jgi:hypothetical protein
VIWTLVHIFATTLTYRSQHRDTKARRHREKPALQGSFEAGFSLCLRAFVSLCCPAIRYSNSEMQYLVNAAWPAKLMPDIEKFPILVIPIGCR